LRVIRSRRQDAIDLTLIPIMFGADVRL